MTDFNESNRIADPSNMSIWPTALRFGGITSLILIVISLLTQLTGISDPANPNQALGCGLGCLNVIILGAGIVLAIKHHRDKELGGTLSFGQGFGMGAATTVIIAVATAIWTYILMAFITPDASEMMREQMLNNAQPGQEEMMETVANLFGSPAGMAIMGVVINILLGVLIALVASAIMKKDPAPNV